MFCFNYWTFKVCFCQKKLFFYCLKSKNVQDLLTSLDVYLFNGYKQFFE